MLDNLVAWLLLPLGLALGWYLGRRAPRVLDEMPHQRPATTGNPFGSDDTDQAITALVKAPEIDSEMVELHLTLGGLFRKRGEVDRALRIHEALLARPTLTASQLQQTQLELGYDYLKAGMVDRAESLLQGLAARGIRVEPALEALQTVYEQSRDWAHAIENNRRLESVTAESRRTVTAQYYCELADQAHAAKDLTSAIKLADQALDEYPECVRGSLLLGKLHQEAGDLPAAIKAYQRVGEQDPRFIPEIVEPLWACYKEQGNVESYLQFLRDSAAEHGGAAPVLAQARLMQETGLNPQQYLTQEFTARPSWPLLEQLLNVTQIPASEPLAPAVDAMRNAIRKTSRSRTRYKCTNCGFTPGLLFWQCPSCKQWASITPIDEPLDE